MVDALTVRVRSMRYPRSERPGYLIEDLELTVPSSRVTALVGPTGAGKTTLLRIIAGLERRFDGRVSLNGRPVAYPGRDIQIVFQDNRLLPWKTVAENLRFALSRGAGVDISERIRRSLEEVQLSEKADRWPKSLSGGEEARVAFARVFLDPPKVLLLDEPFRSVDVLVRRQLQQILERELARSAMTVLLVSHSVEDVVLVSDEVHVFAADPMRRTATFSVPGPRPRDPSDPNVIALTAAITQHMLSAELQRGA